MCEDSGFLVKVQLFWEDHKISQLSSNSFDKSADLLSKYQNKWKITPNFCGLLRKAELKLIIKYFKDYLVLLCQNIQAVYINFELRL